MRFQNTFSVDAPIDEVYPTLPKTSVDYAVMEPASRLPPPGGAAALSDRPPGEVGVVTVLMDVRWLDVGSWPSYAQTLAPDSAGNRVGGRGAAGAVLLHAKDNLVVSDVPDHTIAVLGATGLVVVHTADATLVMPAASAEQLKDLHAKLPRTLR